LVLGAGDLACRLADAIESVRGPLHHSGVRFVQEDHPGDHGVFLEGPAGGAEAFRPLPVVGKMSQIDRIIQEEQPERIIVALSERRGHLPMDVLLRSLTAGIVVEDAGSAFERFTRKLDVERISPSLLIFCKELKKSAVQTALCRLYSLLLAVVGLVLSAPLMLLVALAIKLDSRGSVFFLQERAGKHGRVFRLIKFRTMHQDGGEHDTVWYRENSRRITRVGYWLRRYRLDEFPQFLNVLKGDMNVVGPRPEMASNIPTMARQIPYYGLRQLVAPGITGWAQIMNGYSVSHDEVTEKMRYDLYYVKQRSLWFDFLISLKTIPVLFFNRSPKRTQKETIDRRGEDAQHRSREGTGEHRPGTDGSDGKALPLHGTLFRSRLAPDESRPRSPLRALPQPGEAGRP
jgi:exopolysaccharide biosynthesis polyprenyl glycosylphosphotransferase